MKHRESTAPASGPRQQHERSPVLHPPRHRVEAVLVVVRSVDHREAQHGRGELPVVERPPLARDLVVVPVDVPFLVPLAVRKRLATERRVLVERAVLGLDGGSVVAAAQCVPGLVDVDARDEHVPFRVAAEHVLHRYGVGQPSARACRRRRRACTPRAARSRACRARRDRRGGGARLRGAGPRWCRGGTR